LRIVTWENFVYTCICNAIRECDLRRAARRCGGDAEQVYAELGKRPQCGHCLDEAEEILFEERAPTLGIVSSGYVSGQPRLAGSAS